MKLLAGLAAVVAALVIAVGTVWVIGHQPAASSGTRPTSSPNPRAGYNPEGTFSQQAEYLLHDAAHCRGQCDRHATHQAP